MNPDYNNIRTCDFGKKELDECIHNGGNLEEGQIKYGCIPTFSGCYLFTGKKVYKSGPIVGTLLSLPGAILSIPFVILDYLEQPLFTMKIERKYKDEDTVKTLQKK